MIVAGGSPMSATRRRLLLPPVLIALFLAFAQPAATASHSLHATQDNVLLFEGHHQIDAGLDLR